MPDSGRSRLRLVLVAIGCIGGGAGFGGVFDHMNEGWLLGAGVFLVILGLRSEDLLP